MLSVRGYLSRLRLSQATVRVNSMERVCRGVRGETGASLVEFALACTVLFTMLFGLIAGCLALYAYNFVSDAAREATRWAIVRGSSCTSLDDCGATSAQIQSYVQTLGYPGMSASNVTVTTTWLNTSATTPTTWTTCVGSGCNIPGNAVQVMVTYSFPLNVPFLSSQTLSLSSTSQMIIAN